MTHSILPTDRSLPVAGTISQPPTKAVPSRCRRVRQIVRGLGSLAALSLLVWIFRGRLLASVALAWVVNEPPVSADAILVLPMSTGRPVLEAARLYRSGSAPRVLLVHAALRPTDKIGITEPYDETTRQVLLKNGVPDTAVAFVGADVPAFMEIPDLLRRWMADHQAGRILAVTEQFPSRRVKWCLDRAVTSASAEVRVIATPSPDYTLQNWWRSEPGLIAFENEVVRSLYYRVKK